MKPSTLQSIKNELVKINNVIMSLIPLTAGKSLKMIQLFLNNASRNPTHCVNYSHDKEEVELDQFLTFLENMKVLSPSDRVIDWLVDEVKMAIDGYVMSEAYDDYDPMDQYEDEIEYDNIQDEHDLTERDDEFVRKQYPEDAHMFENTGDNGPRVVGKINLHEDIFH